MFVAKVPWSSEFKYQLPPNWWFNFGGLDVRGYLPDLLLKGTGVHILNHQLGGS